VFVVLLTLLSSCSTPESGRTSYRVEKYYADVITKDGNGAFFSAVKANVNGRRVVSVATNTYTARGSSNGSQMMKEVDISLLPDSLTFTGFPGVKGSLHLTKYARSRRYEIHKSDNGSVTWEIIAFPCDAQARVDGTDLVGIGYADRIVQTVPQSSLPFETQWRGRTATDSMSFAWLIWEGPYPRSVGLINGVSVSKMSVTDSSVVLGDYEILHTDSRVLSEMAGSQIPTMQDRSANELHYHGDRSQDERRWLSRSTIKRISTGEMIGSTWTIHERIDKKQ